MMGPLQQMDGQRDARTAVIDALPLLVTDTLGSGAPGGRDEQPSEGPKGGTGDRLAQTTRERPDRGPLQPSRSGKEQRGDDGDGKPDGCRGDENASSRVIPPIEHDRDGERPCHQCGSEVVGDLGADGSRQEPHRSKADGVEDASSEATVPEMNGVRGHVGCEPSLPLASSRHRRRMTHIRHLGIE